MQDELKSGFSASNLEKSYDRYIVKNYYKTGALFSNAFKGVGEIMGKSQADTEQLFHLGAQIGILFQLYDDYLDLMKTSESDKESFKDIRDSIVGLHFFVAYREILKNEGENQANKFSQMYLKANKSESEIEQIRSILLRDDIDVSAQNMLSSYHDAALRTCESIFGSKTSIPGATQSFVNLIGYVVQRLK